MKMNGKQLSKPNKALINTYHGSPHSTITATAAGPCKDPSSIYSCFKFMARFNAPMTKRCPKRMKFWIRWMGHWVSFPTGLNLCNSDLVEEVMAHFMIACKLVTIILAFFIFYYPFQDLFLSLSVFYWFFFPSSLPYVVVFLIFFAFIVYWSSIYFFHFL